MVTKRATIAPSPGPPPIPPISGFDQPKVLVVTRRNHVIGPRLALTPSAKEPDPLPDWELLRPTLFCPIANRRRLLGLLKVLSLGLGILDVPRHQRSNLNARRPPLSMRRLMALRERFTTSATLSISYIFCLDFRRLHFLAPEVRRGVGEKD